jgi:adenylate cyclase
MSPESFKRKLTAILSADVKGYSRLMGENEAETVKTLTAYRRVMGELIQQHRGRVIDSPGDNILAEFASVVDAVQCSVAAQNEFKARNAELSENRRMEFRIGVNLGDVIEEEGRIYGDGVNIAARLEALAEPGGICISKTAFDQIETKLPLGYEFLGEQQVKNIAKPVGAYKVLMEPRVIDEQQGEIKTRRPDKPSLPLPDKPSIAVLPFVNMSDDPEQEYFSDGISEDIITSLSHLPSMLVIARNSTFIYKGKSVNVHQVSRELGVKYILEGSVRKVGNRVRVTAQLIDGTTGHHLWAERYDRKLEDIFAIQDEITFNILNEIQVKLTEGEHARLYSRGTKNIDAYLRMSQALSSYHHVDRGGNALARQICQEVIALEPNWEFPYSLLGWTHWMDVTMGWSNSPEESVQEAFQCAERSLSLNESTFAHALLGWLYTLAGEHEKAILEGERSIALAPNSAEAHVWYARTLVFAGEPETALPLIEKGFRLNPFPKGWYFVMLGAAYSGLRRTEEAIAAYKKAIFREPTSLIAHVTLTSAYALDGREIEARTEATEVLRIDPKFSLERYAKGLTFKNQAVRDRIVASLRKSGLK